MKIIETTMLVFNSEKYEKDIRANEVMALDLSVEKEFIEVPFTFLMKDVSSFSPDYSGDDTIDLPKSKHFVSRTFVFFSNGDSKSISMSYDTFKGMFKEYHNSKDKVSFKVNNIQNPSIENEKDICIMTIRCEDEPKSQREIDYDNLLAKTKENDLQFLGAKLIREYSKLINGEYVRYCDIEVNDRCIEMSYQDKKDIEIRNIHRGITTTFKK